MQPRIAVAITADYNGRWAQQVVADAKTVATGVKAAGSSIGQAMHGANVNVANLASQFNDIGVTLASGQSPLTIALQQGTQISQVLGPLGAAGAAKALGSAFLSIISPLSLITIGVIAVGAAAAQWLMNINQQSPSAEERLKAHKQWLDKVLLGYDEARKGADKYLDETGKLPSGAANSELGAQQIKTTEQFNAALKALKDTRDSYLEDKTKIFWETPDAIAQADALMQVQGALDVTNPQFDELITALTEIKNSAANDKIAKIAQEMLNGLGAAKAFRGEMAATASSIASLAAAAAGFPSIGKMFQDSIGDLKGLGMPNLDPRGQAAAARDAGLKAAGTDTVVRTVVQKEYNAALARIATRDAEEEALKRNKQFEADANRQATSYRSVIESLQLQTVELGLSAREQEKLNQVKAAGVEANSAEANAIRAAVDALYDQREALQQVEDQQKQVQAVMGELQTTTANFVSMFRKGLMEGKGLWAAFAAAGSNALDTLADKLLNSAIASFFGNLIGSSFGSLGNDIGPGATLSGLQSFIKSANGNVMSGPGIGAYSGTVVSRPTVFPFASGVGLMGEAGPEAILPLKRGANGRLGVASEGGGGTVNHFHIDAKGAEIGVETKIVRAIKAMVPGMIKSEAPAAVASAQRNKAIG